MAAVTSEKFGLPLQMKFEKQAAPLVFLAAGLLCYVLRVTVWFTAVPGDLGDARFNSVVLEHLFQWLTGDAASLWMPSYYFPAQGTLAFSDNHFGSGLFYIIFRLMGLSRELSFDGWFAVGQVLNFVSMYMVMRKLDFSPVASATAGFIFAFSLPSMAQESHAQLTWRFAIPPACLSFVQLVQERRAVRLAQLAGWATLQFYCSIYLGVFMSYLLAAMAAAMLVPGFRPSPLARADIKHSVAQNWGMFTLTFLFAAATGWLLLQYHSVSKSYGMVRSIAEVIPMLPRPQSYLLADNAPAYRWLARNLSAPPVRHEHQLFLGFVPLLLSFLALARAGSVATSPAMRRLLGMSVAITLLLMACTLRVGERSLYDFALTLPGIASIRAVSRVVLVMMFPVAIMAAIGAEHLLSRRATRWVATWLVLAALSLETLAYQPFGTDFAKWRERLSPLATLAEKASMQADSVLYVSGRAEDPFYLTELDAMVFAQDRKMATLNGYSGYAPIGTIDASPCISASVRVDGISDSVLTRQNMSPDSLLNRTVWLQAEKCPLVHASTDTATNPPDEAQAKKIRLSATVSESSATSLSAKLRIQNDGGSTLQTLSKNGHPLMLVWRFMPSEAKGVDWGPWQTLALTLAPGEYEELQYSIPKPIVPGTYELEFTLVAQGYRWLHEMGMSIARTQVTIASPR